MRRSLPTERTTTPRVEVDPDLHLHPVRAARVVRVALERLLHPEGGIAGAHGVVLVGQRRTEQRHDPVAHHLVHRALVAVNGLHHAFEHGVEDLAGFLGIAVGEQLHRALEVGEEDGHLLALAFQRRLRGEDLLGEVLGGVRIRGGELCFGGLRSAETSATPSTELVAWLIREAG
jgi:hypothetical protein